VRYSEEQLRAAIGGASSWRQVNTRLGRAPDANRSGLREAAEKAGIDTSHIRSPNERTYTDDQLREAVKAAATWADVARALDKRSGAAVKTIRQTAERLGVDVSHLRTPPDRPAPGPKRDGEIFRMFGRVKSLTKVGAKFGLSPERVRQIVRREERSRAG
jgi:hypothetical protein